MSAESLMAAPEQHLLSLLTEAERQQLLVTWNDTRADYPADACIHNLFALQVQQTPNAVAVVGEDRQLTYKALHERSNQLAHHLHRLGVGPEVLVGICVERSADMVIELLGILKAGGAYVPLDPAYPSERLAFMLEDAQVAVLLTQERLRARLPRQEAPLVCLDADWGVIAQQPVDDLCCVVTPANLAYVLYTSGSTGQPKGVLGLHRGAVNRFNWMWEVYPFEPGEICCQKTSLSFVDSVWEIFGPLLRGVPSVIIPDQVRNDPQQLIQTLARTGVTRIVLVPSLLRTLLDADPNLQERLPALRFWVSSGEALSVELCQRFQEQMPRGRLVNLYGSSEVSADVTWYDTKDREVLSCVPIGRPIANTQIYLLDEHLHPVPVGVPGELHVGGVGLARGYLNRPELTAERFIPHPFSDELGARLYKTGDLARYLPDGNVEFLGRLDHQVKIRGFRIELGEIEAVLMQHPTVRQAVVVAREDVPGDTRLAAYVVPQPQQTPTPGELRRLAQERLPDYMVPAAFVLLEALPLTPNGKVDRRALPAPLRSRSEVHAPVVAPTLLVHQQLIEIWEELLDVRPIGIRDNFFDLGGHSLLAAGMAARIEQVWGKKLALATLFAGPTIEQLAQALLQARDDETDSRTPVVALQTGGSRRPFFFLHGHELGTAPYCFPLARDLGPDQPFFALDPYRLNDLPVPPSMETIAAAHLEALRAIQPDGPYLLGGFCNGGLVAYEMARQLHAQGQAVDLLVLMDPMPLPQDFRLLYLVLRDVLALVRLSPERQVAWFVRLRHLVQHLYNHLRGHRGDAEDLAPALATFILTDEALHHDYPGLLHWSVLAYRPPSVYPGKVTFFWPADEPWHARWWRPVAEATAVEEHFIPGRHRTWKTDHLPALSERLRLCLDNAHAAVKAPVAGGHTND